MYSQHIVYRYYTCTLSVFYTWGWGILQLQVLQVCSYKCIKVTCWFCAKVRTANLPAHLLLQAICPLPTRVLCRATCGAFPAYSSFATEPSFATCRCSRFARPEATLCRACVRPTSTTITVAPLSSSTSGSHWPSPHCVSSRPELVQHLPTIFMTKWTNFSPTTVWSLFDKS